MAKKKIKNSNKNNLSNFLIALVGIFLIGSFVLMVVKDVKENNKNKIKEVSYKEYQKEISKDKYTIVLLGRPKCSHCINYKPLMNQALENYQLEGLYLDVNGLKENEFTELRSSINALRNEYSDEGEPVIPTPTTIIFKNGIELESKSANIGYDGFVNMLVRNGVVNNEN